MIRTLPLALLVTGCFSVPPYAPEEAVTFTAAGAGGVVAGNLASSLPFELHFPDGDGFRFPNALKIAGADVLGHDPGQACSQADELGILFSPSPRISATGGAPRVTNILTPVLPGPAVVQMKLDWATRLQCNGARSPGGTSTFTVFPDGRIVRYDKIADPSSSEISGTLCSCGEPQADFAISTFWTLARDAFSKFRYSGEPDVMMPLPNAGAEISNNPGWSCVDDGARQVVFAWSNNNGVRIRGHDRLIQLGFQFMINASMLGAFSLEHGSALFIGRSTGCTDAIARARAYHEPSMLTVNGVTVPLSLRDRIYGGDLGDGTLPGIELQKLDHFELTGAVTTSYAVWLRFPRAVDAVRAVRVGAMGVWYVPQRVDDRSWIIFFKDPLQLGQTIKIEPI